MQGSGVNGTAHAAPTSRQALCIVSVTHGHHLNRSRPVLKQRRLAEQSSTQGITSLPEKQRQSRCALPALHMAGTADHTCRQDGPRCRRKARTVRTLWLRTNFGRESKESGEFQANANRSQGKPRRGAWNLLRSDQHSQLLCGRLCCISRNVRCMTKCLFMASRHLGTRCDTNRWRSSMSTSGP